MTLFKKLTASLLLFFLAVGCTQQQSQEKEMTKQEPSTDYTKAVAVIHPGQNQDVSGTVTFEKVNNGVRVQASLSGLQEGKHGFHIHQYGDCRASKDFSSAGGHYNPENVNHGAPSDSVRHVGDMGNIEANAEGEATLTYVDDVLTLNGPQSIIGHAVIVHQNEDTFVQPTGSAGPQIGCGVVGIANLNYSPTTQE